MRVDFTNLGVEPPDKGKTGRAGRSGSAADPTSVGTDNSSAADSGVAADQTQLSFGQARVQSLEASVLAAPDVRQEKVTALQQSIATGNYAVDPARVADAMTSEFASAQVR
jgi:flagellar biosynthesis anti-sigma factor FlgM